MSLSYEMPEFAITGFITFFSIVFGFQITSLSILFGSSYIKRLGGLEDGKLTGRSQLQVLAGYFERAAYISLVAIILLLLSSLLGLDGSDVEMMMKCKIEFSNIQLGFCWQTIFTASVASVITVNILFMTILLRFLLHAFIEEGSRQK